MRTVSVFSLINVILLIAIDEVRTIQAEVGEVENQVNQIVEFKSTTLPSTTTTTTTVAPKSSKNKKTKDNVPNKLPDCYAECTCSEKRINCEGKMLKTIPYLKRNSNVTSINLSNNSIEFADLSMLPLLNLESLDLSFNSLKNFSSNKIDPLKLEALNLSNNQLESLTMLASIRLPALELLDVSVNPLKELGETLFYNATNLQILKITETKLERIHESTFARLLQLRSLNMSDTTLSPKTAQLGPRQFVNNKKLELVDLSNTSSVEVPAALRSTSSIKTLILNRNLMTSLRASDFIARDSLVYLEISHCTKLTKVDEQAFYHLRDIKTLILSDNPRLNYISKDAFDSENQHSLDLFDIGRNNITKLSDPHKFSALEFRQIDLSGNPWDCDCDLAWIQTVPLSSRSPVHCKSPEQFKDLEISSFLSTRDCEAEASGYHTIIVTAFLIFIFGLLIAIIIQKSDICYRLPPRDQHSSVYYTKSKFSAESVQEV